jgi:hypothetical protein
MKRTKLTLKDGLSYLLAHGESIVFAGDTTTFYDFALGKITVKISEIYVITTPIM